MLKKFKLIYLDELKSVVAIDEFKEFKIEKEDWFLTTGVNLVSLNKQYEIQQCQTPSTKTYDRIISYDCDYADPFGWSFFVFKEEESFRIIAGNNPLLSFSDSVFKIPLDFLENKPEYIELDVDENGKPVTEKIQTVIYTEKLKIFNT